MQFIKVAFLSLFVFLLSANTGATQSREDILSYVLWIEDNSEFEYNGEPLPRIVHKGHEEVQLMAFSEEEIERSREFDYNLPIVAAIYLPENDRIIGNEGYDLSLYENHHILVHELVHYMQDINGHLEDDECPLDSEHDAYVIQKQWQQEVNHPENQPTDLFIAMIKGGCKDHHY